jgi:hypothetical protein
MNYKNWWIGLGIVLLALAVSALNGDGFASSPIYFDCATCPSGATATPAPVVYGYPTYPITTTATPSATVIALDLRNITKGIDTSMTIGIGALILGLFIWYDREEDKNKKRKGEIDEQEIEIR